MIYVVHALIFIGLFFALAGVVGLIRMPDAYCRMQSATNVSTLGVIGVMVAGLLYCIFILQDWEMSVKMAVLTVFYIVTNPIGSHAIARGAYMHGIYPEKPMICDQYGEDLENDD